VRGRHGKEVVAVFSKPLILLWVDEDLARGRPSRVELRRRGARVLMARSAERATELSELFMCDLFVLSDDVGTAEPGDLAAHLRSGFPDAEIILLSSKPREEPQGVGLGLLYYGAQPLALETLIGLIDMAFPGRLEHRPPPKPEHATVLCVDDDPQMLHSLSRLLTRHGYRATLLEDPREVLEAISEIAPDLAILDVMMPGIDGRALARKIRSVYRDLIPLVMLSARSSSADIAAGYEDGASAYLPKPCSPERLLDVVDYYVGDLDREEREALESEGRVRVGRGAGVVR
jgi:DNA-binding response OmpR family regulator